MNSRLRLKNKDFVTCLMSRGVETLSHIHANGKTWIHMICKYGNDQTIPFVIQYIEQNNLESLWECPDSGEYGYYPIHYLCKYHYLMVPFYMKCVKTSKYSINYESKHGITPLYLLCKHATPSIAIYAIRNYDIQATFGDTEASLIRCVESYAPRSVQDAIYHKYGFCKNEPDEYCF